MTFQIAWRLTILLGFAYLFFTYLTNPNHYCILDPLNLCIHEGGHLIFAFCGEFLGFAGGTIIQLAAPIAGMWNFYKQDDYFSITLCFGWLATNLFNVSYYMADACSMELPLVSLGGGESMHDWHYLFGKMGLLQQDHMIANAVWMLGFVSMLLCFFLGSWILWQMRKPIL
jgi:hypothetical protein